MPFLKKRPTLDDLQKYVKQLEKERGFKKDSLLQKCLLLGEEVGELFKAIRKSEKIKVNHSSIIDTVEDELADIVIYLCAIANRLNIDLEKAFREKEKLNKKRIWKVR